MPLSAVVTCNPYTPYKTAPSARLAFIAVTFAPSKLVLFPSVVEVTLALAVPFAARCADAASAGCSWDLTPSTRETPCDVEKLASAQAMAIDDENDDDDDDAPAAAAAAAGNDNDDHNDDNKIMLIAAMSTSQRYFSKDESTSSLTPLYI